MYDIMNVAKGTLGAFVLPSKVRYFAGVRVPLARAWQNAKWRIFDLI